MKTMKQMAFLGAAVLCTIGAYVPVLLLGSSEETIVWSILGGMVGGFFGIWAGVKLYKRMQ